MAMSPLEKLLPRDRRCLTHTEIAPLFGITRARVHQIEQVALRKIHKALSKQAREAGMGIREFLFG